MATSQSRDLVREVSDLNEQVKTLALNLAIYLAKARSKGVRTLDRLEPEFIRLVNGTVKAVQEMTALINAAGESQTPIGDPSKGRVPEYELDVKLQSIAMQCKKIVGDLEREARRRGTSESSPTA
jgi:hypothetical protein